MTKEEFIAKAKERHGDKYDYSFVEIAGNNQTKVWIECNTCGLVFEQSVNSHLQGHGCPDCAGNKKLTTEKFIAKARKKHGNKYDYSLVNDIINNQDKVKIKCNVCGCVFEQRIYSHLQGHGCPDCAKERRKTAQTMTREEFIAKAMEKHGNKYDYSLVKITGNNTTKVKVKCNTCGTVFEQRISSHLYGKGCPNCAGNKKLTKEGFITKSKLIHGNKYGYNNVVYVNNRTIVNITCPIHGDFPQKPNNHMSLKQGCPWCKKSKLETETGAFLEQNNISYDTQKKFPWLKSNKNWPMRLDFYLPEYNIAIECQGIQHYLEEGNGHFKTEGVKEAQKNDKLKYNLCKEHDVPIYYIRYDDNVEEKLNEIISKIKTKQ